MHILLRRPSAPQRCFSGRQGADRAPKMRPMTHRLRRCWTRCSAVPDPEQLKKMQETVDAAMKENPQFREKMNQMQEAMKDPRVQQQMKETVAYMQSAEAKARIQALRDDPELKEKFDAIEKGGVGAMMKAMGDVKFLEKVGRAVGPPPGMQTTPPPADSLTADTAPKSDSVDDLQMPEINTLLDAAKYGDIEAVEDFLAIGKDPNLVDEFNRSPLHFAVSIQHMEIIDALLTAGADIEIRDSKDNTPLHYAAGYGRTKALRRLLEAGADGSVRNESGKTPADVARLSDQNPVLQEEDLMGQLNKMASV